MQLDSKKTYRSCRLVNAVKSIDVDRLETADLSACVAPDNVKKIELQCLLTKRHFIVRDLK